MYRLAGDRDAVLIDLDRTAVLGFDLERLEQAPQLLRASDVATGQFLAPVLGAGG